MKLVKNLVVLLSPLLFLALTACEDSDEVHSVELVPQGSNLLVEVRVDTLLQDADIAALYEAIPPDEGQLDTFQGLLDMAQKEIGIDLTDFSSLLIFGDTSQLEQEAQIIARGTFDKTVFLDVLQRVFEEEEFSSSLYKGYQVHTPADEENAGGFVFLDETTLFFGSIGMAHRVIEIREGDADPLRGNVLDAYNSLDGSLLRAVFQIPPEALEDLGQSLPDLPLPINVAAFKDIELVSIAIGKKETDFTAEVTLGFAREASAASLGETIDGAVKLFRGFTTNEKVIALLDKLEINVEGATVSLNYQVDVEELKSLVQDPDFEFPNPFAITEIVTEGRPDESQIIRERLLLIQDPIHVAPGQPHEPYNTTPPTSGPHYAQTAPWGISSEPIPNELQVHNLEHGGVMIQYDPDAEPLIRQAGLEKLIGTLPDFPCFLIVAPYPNLDHTIALTAWGTIEYIDHKGAGELDSAPILDFVNAHRGRGPERIGCTPAS